MLNDRCSALSESVKSLEEKLQEKTNELDVTQNRYMHKLCVDGSLLVYGGEGT